MKKKVVNNNKHNSFRSNLSLLHWFIPHKSNQYHPVSIRWNNLFGTAIVSLVVQIIYNFATTGQVAILGKTTTISSSQMLKLTNEQRSAKQLKPYYLDPLLSQAAELKVNDMVENNYWSHISPSGKPPWAWIDDVGYKYFGAGENLAKNFPDENSVINAWMASSTHKENILNPDYNAMGMATAQDIVAGKLVTIIVSFYAQPNSSVTPKNTTTITTLPANDEFKSINNPLVYLAITIKNMNPVSMGILSLALILAIISISTFLQRTKLPKEINQAWHRHHGLYKAISMMLFVVLVLVLSAGTSI